MTLKTGPAASVARVGDDFAFPSALLAGGIADCLPEEAVYDPLDLSCTLAGRACLDVGCILCPFAAAFGAWDEFLYAPFKNNTYFKKYQQMVTDACARERKPCFLVNMRERVKGRFQYKDINKFKAAVVFPYAVLSYYLADLVTTAIPMFVPSPSFIVENGIAHDIKASDSHYCGARFQEPPKHPKSKHPFSPEDHSEKATEYWLQYASYYTPCSIVFQNMSHLVYLMQKTNYSEVYQCNLNYRKQILEHNRREWNKLFQKIEKHRRMPNSIRESLDWYKESTFY